MRKSGRILPLAALLTVICADGAFAQAQQSAPISTAETGSGAATAGDAVDQQIAAFVQAPLHAAPSDDGVAPERQIHGEVSAGIGANGYHSFYGRVDIPVGTSAMVSVAAGQESIRFRGYRDTRNSLAVGAQLGGLGRGSALTPSCGWGGLQLPGDKPCARWTGLAPYGSADFPDRALAH